MVETDFLDALQLYLGRPGLLQPAPVLVGVVDPVQDTDLPSVVISLHDLARPGSGLGERSTVITGGALSTDTRIDLGNPVLPQDASLTLVSGDRLQVTLFHGGLVRADGTTGPLTGEDLVVTVAGSNRPVVAGAPTGNEVSADPLIGRLTFATPLPASGLLTAQYFIGTWEQRVVRMTGVLRVSVWGASPAAVTTLSASVVAALHSTGPTAFQGVQKLTLQQMGTIARPSASFPAGRARDLEFGFEFEGEVNVPESSGGLIQRVPIDAFVG